MKNTDRYLAGHLKTADEGSPAYMWQYPLIGGAVGGTAGGLYGAYATYKAIERENEARLRRGKSERPHGEQRSRYVAGTIGGAIPLGLFGAVSGYDVANNLRAHEGMWGAGRRGGHAPQDAWRKDALNAFDPKMHPRMRRVWETVVNSTEMEDPVRRQAAMDFVKNVHRARSPEEVERLRHAMDSAAPDSSVGQMMRVLFHKFHGGAEKQGSWVERTKLAAELDVICLFFGIT